MRVLVRTPTRADEAAFLAAVRRSRKLHRPFVYPPETATAYRAALRRSRQPSHEMYVVIDAESDGLAGVINLNEIVRGGLQSAYLGYYAFEPHAGRGLMREGMRATLRRAFRELGLHRVEANIQPANQRSIDLVRGLGFQREGFSPRYLKIGGRWRDHERWALLREQLPPR